LIFNKGKKLDNILSSFNKTIKELVSLQESISYDIVDKHSKIEELEGEVDVLIETNKKASNALSVLNNIVGGNV